MCAKIVHENRTNRTKVPALICKILWRNCNSAILTCDWLDRKRPCWFTARWKSRSVALHNLKKAQVGQTWCHPLDSSCRSTSYTQVQRQALFKTVKLPNTSAPVAAAVSRRDEESRGKETRTAQTIRWPFIVVQATLDTAACIDCWHRGPSETSAWHANTSLFFLYLLKATRIK